MYTQNCLFYCRNWKQYKNLTLEELIVYVRNIFSLKLFIEKMFNDIIPS